MYRVERRRRARALALAIALSALPATLHAQAASCRVPRAVPAPRLETPPPGGVRRSATDGYLLALSWSPEYCHANSARPDAAFQCGDGARFGFVLHGLWPVSDGAAAPQYCAPAERVPEAVIRETLCASPSAQLIQHEWTRHGTCVTARPENYFRAARGLYAAVRYPDMAALSARRGVTAGALRQALAARNPGIGPTAIAIDTNARGWLEEVRICLDRRFRPRACPAASRGIADRAVIRIALPR